MSDPSRIENNIPTYEESTLQRLDNGKGAIVTTKIVKLNAKGSFKRKGRKTLAEKGLLTQAEKVEAGLQEKAWVPGQWKPIYEAIVARSIQGFSNEAIAAQFNYTKEHISNILNTPEAYHIKKLSIDNTRRLMLDDKDRLSIIRSKTLDRVIQLADNEEKFTESPLAVLNVLMGFQKDVVQGEMKIKKNLDANGDPIDRGRVNGGGNVFIQTEQVNLLMDGLRKSDEVDRLHSGEVKEDAKSN